MSTTASANVEGFDVFANVTILPNAPIPVGLDYTCYISYGNNPKPIESYRWDIRYSFPGGCVAPSATGWFLTGMEETMTNGASVPGTHTIRLTVKYEQIFHDDGTVTRPPDTVITKDVTILKADNVKMPVPGANDPAHIDSEITLYYQVRTGNHECWFPAGTAQERLTNRVFMGIPQFDTDWVPITASPTFYLQEGVIFDTHWAGTTEAQWNSLNNNDEIQSATQELRIVWSDMCWQPHFDQELNSVNLVHRKVSATQWQVEAGSL